ncbi:hypothetical protein A4H97_15825 [Niastella yeongjuensis]|uniref:Uncharacterized protein n=2 Tax=Niastella yeongjuensis TaxID=354355 RepID=A0A1V9E571_9BACT|nr:hypothetical protein A4H97_15825 [Niastella yeongjuensis]
MKKPFDLTGSVGKISIYNMRGFDEPIVRRKGGPTKKMVKNRASFETTRRNNSEFGGRAHIASLVMQILRPMKYVGDYNLAGPLTSLFIPIQVLDTVSEHGERNIELTKNPGLLTGFNLNRRTPFTNIITNPISYTLSKEKLSATVTIPELIPGANFFPQEQFTWYKFISILGVVEDVFYGARGYKTKAGYPLTPGYRVIEQTGWFNITPKSQAVTLTCSFNASPAEVIGSTEINNYSCLLAIGIAYGSMERGEVEMVKYVGGGKVLAME